MTRKRARLYVVLLFMLGAGTATGLTLYALGDNLSYFRTPTDIKTGNCPECSAGRDFRLGGLVVKDSLKKESNRLTFRVTDLKNNLMVTYQGVPPDLFREGQGVIAEGRMDQNGVFNAQNLLAKHDEKYMPPEITKELKDGANGK